MLRWFRFLLMIVIGAAIGMAYGWLISPVTYVDTAPGTLRVDYKADYVLMVAEAYTNEMDISAALQRLASLGAGLPSAHVRQALDFAQQQGYNEADIQRMTTLMTDLQRLEASSGGAGATTP